jgi:hypothetical protein
MDYRALLIRYMAQVRDTEGKSFINNVGNDGTFLTKDDKAELLKLEIEAHRLLIDKP